MRCWLEFGQSSKTSHVKRNKQPSGSLSPQVKEAAAVTLSNEEVFMATQFKDFVKTIVVISRGGGGKKAQGKRGDLFPHTDASPLVFSL